MKKLDFSLFLGCLLIFLSIDTIGQNTELTIRSNPNQIAAPTTQKTNQAGPQTGTGRFVNGVEVERCGIEKIMKDIYDNPVLLRRYKNNKKPLSQSIINSQKVIACDGSNTINVPVAFHFDNSFSCADEACMLSEIADAISTLNVDFASNTGTSNWQNCPAAYPDISTGTCITFYLAAPPACATNLDVDCDGAITIGQFAGGYNGGGNGAGACWDDYLNIFVQSPQSGNLGVADQIPGYLNAAGPGEGVSLGSPYFGGVGGSCGSIDTDNTFNLGKTLAHEIGHYLGLPHIWGDVNGGGCGGDDGFADTPDQSTSYFGCPGGCVASGCGGNQQTANIMNYTNDACMDMFTEDQAAAMNFYANQFFGGLNIPAANPTELTSLCTSNSCEIVCPSAVTSPFAGSADVCAGAGSYTLPSTFAGLALDVSGSETTTWSAGNYLSAGGTGVASTTVALTNPAGCNAASVTYYLNVGCVDGSVAPINAGTFTLNVYPDPAQFTAADLATISGENTCDEPIITPNCPGVTVVADAANPTFPVAAGVSGTANYTLEYAAVAGAPDCCATGVGGEIVTNGDFEAGTTGWIEVEEVPIGTPNPNPFGIIGVSNTSLNGTADAWFGGWGGTSLLSLSQDIEIPATCGTAELTFDFLMDCANGGVTFSIAVNGVVYGSIDCTDGANGSIAPFDLIAAGAPTGNVTLTLIGEEDGTGTDEPDIYIDNVSIITGNCATAECDIPVTADFDCQQTACASVDLNILFDGFPGQTSWDITDASGGVVANGGTYGSMGGNTATTENTCLFDGCYTLNFRDALNNGMCPFRANAAATGTFITPGTTIIAGSIVASFGLGVTPGLCGNYTLLDANGSPLVSGGGSFGALESQTFCLSGGVAAKTSNLENSISRDLLSVYPTLATGFINLEFGFDNETAIEIAIYDINGKIVQQYNNLVVKNWESMQLNIADLNRGSYFIRMNSLEGSTTKRFIKN